jgi:hypothetical protein
MSMHPDLEWLASHVSKWPEGYASCDVVVDEYVLPYGRYRYAEYKEGGQWSFFDWQLARDAWLDNTETPEEKEAWEAMEEKQASSRSDGSTASYYQLPEGCTELQHLISHRNMNAQIGEIFRACYRYGMASHSDQMRDARKILFYAMAEVERLELLEASALRAGELKP